MIQDCLHVTHYFTTFLLYYFHQSAVYYDLLMGARNVVYYNQLMSAWHTLISYHNIWKKKCPQQVLMCSFSQPSTKNGKILQSMYNMFMLCIGSLFFLRKCICCDLMLLFFIFANFFHLPDGKNIHFHLLRIHLGAIHELHNIISALIWTSSFPCYCRAPKICQFPSLAQTILQKYYLGKT